MCLDLQDYRAAIYDFTIVIGNSATFLDAYKNRAIAHVAMEDYKSAIEDYTEIINICPNNVECLLNRANAYNALKNYDEAIADCTLAIGKRSEFSDAFYTRGYIKYSKGDLRGALADYNEVLKLDTQNAYVYIQIAKINKQKSKRKEAILNLQQAISIFSNKSMISETQVCQQEVNKLEDEIKNIPWWNRKLF